MKNQTPATRRSSPTCWNHFCGGLRQLAFLAALVVAGGAMAWIGMQTHLDREIRRAVEQRLGRRLAGSPYVVSVREARRIMGPDERNQGIEVRGVEVRDTRTDLAVVAVDEMWLACACDLMHLLDEQIHVRHVTIRRPRVRLQGGIEVWREWTRLMSVPTPDSVTPIASFAVEEGTLEWQVDARRPKSAVMLGGLDVVMVQASPEALHKRGWRQATENAADVAHVRLQAGGELVGKLRVDLFWDRAREMWELEGSAEDLRVARELLGLLPEDWSELRETARNLDARGSVTFDARSPEKAGEWPQFSVAGQLREGRWSDSRVPLPVTDLEADFRADADGLEIQRLSARCGSAEMSGSFRMEQWNAEGACEGGLRLRRFSLSQSWIELMPGEWRDAWAHYRVLGEFDVDLTARFDGRTWHPEGVASARGLSARFDRFPYPLSGGTGRLELHGSRVVSRDLTFQMRDRSVAIELDVVGLGPTATGKVSFQAPQGLPIDETFLAAMEGPAASFARSLQPRGEVIVHGSIERQEASLPWHRQLELNFQNCSIQYERFGYPIEKIQGKVIYDGQTWHIGELSGRNDSAYLVARGTWVSNPKSLRLDVEAYDVPLEEELRAALPPGMQKVWAQAQPRGTIDYIAIGLRSPHPTRPLGVDVTLQKNHPSQNVEGRNLTLRPRDFPYAIDNLVGNIRYLDGDIELEGGRAEHARTQFRARGRGHVEPHGDWQMQLSELSVDRLQIDHDLLTALPRSASVPLARLNWTGPLYLDGQVWARGSAQAADPLQLGWDVRVDIENGSFAHPVPVEQIRGSAQWVGTWNGSTWGSGAELRVDSAFVRGVQITQIHGPVRFLPDRIIAGDAWSDARPTDRPPRQVSANLFGGSLSTDAVVQLGDDVGFRVHAGVQNMSLQEIAREFTRGRRDISGRAFASLQMEGSTRGTHTWRGLGKVTCRDTNIEQIPFLVSMMKNRSQRATEPNLALSDVDFSVQGDRIYFDRIDLKGESLSLRGRGEMNLDRIVDLQFYALMGRDDFWLPVVSPVLAEASKQMLEIRVTGPMESPVVDRKVVPAINDALQQMFPEMAARNAETPLINRVPTPRQLLQRSPR